MPPGVVWLAVTSGSTVACHGTFKELDIGP